MSDPRDGDFECRFCHTKLNEDDLTAAKDGGPICWKCGRRDIEDKRPMPGLLELVGDGEQENAVIQNALNHLKTVQFNGKLYYWVSDRTYVSGPKE